MILRCACEWALDLYQIAMIYVVHQSSNFVHKDKSNGLWWSHIPKDVLYRFQVNNNDLHMLLMLFFIYNFFFNYTLYADSHTLMLDKFFYVPKVYSDIFNTNLELSFSQKIPILLDIVIGQWCSFHVPKVPILFLIICTSFPMVSWKFPNSNSIVLKWSLIDNSPKLCMFPDSIPKCPNFSH